MGRLSPTVDLARFAGQNVRLALEWNVPETLTGPAWFELDNVSLVAGLAPPPALATQGLSRPGNGAFQLDFTATLGRPYTV